MTAPPVTAPPPARPRPSPRQQAAWQLVAVVSAVFLVLPGLAAAAMFALRHHQERFATYHRPLALLRVSAPGGNVLVAAGQPGTTQVAAHLTWYAGLTPRVREVWAGRTLTVTAAACAAKPPWHCPAGLEIRVPPGVPVRAAAGTGSLTLAGLTGPVHARVTSGQLSLQDLRGPAWLAATSGAISAVSLTSARVHAAVTSGSLALRFVLPPMRVAVTATSGYLSVTVPPGSRYRVAGGAGSGISSVSPGLASAGSPRLITVSATSGSVRLGYDYGQPGPPVPLSPPRQPRPRSPAAPHKPAGQAAP